MPPKPFCAPRLVCWWCGISSCAFCATCKLFHCAGKSFYFVTSNVYQWAFCYAFLLCGKVALIKRSRFDTATVQSLLLSLTRGLLRVCFVQMNIAQGDGKSIRGKNCLIITVLLHSERLHKPGNVGFACRAERLLDRAVSAQLPGEADSCQLSWQGACKSCRVFGLARE